MKHRPNEGDIVSLCGSLYKVVKIGHDGYCTCIGLQKTYIYAWVSYVYLKAVNLSPLERMMYGL